MIINKVENRINQNLQKECCLVYQRDQAILEQRHAVLMQAFLAHPERFNHKQPQLKKLPKAVYINPPQSSEIENKSGQSEVCLAS